MTELDRFRGCLLGLACGDAVGTTVEFQPRGSFEPVTDMVGGGTFRLKPGEWTDDTSMALCLATSLTELGRFDPADQMRRYLRWMDDGYLSSNGICFDVGNATFDALERFRATGEPFCGSTDSHTSGNGCLMRLAPVAMFFHPNKELAVRMSGESARTTHGSVECIDCSRLLGGILVRALSGANKKSIALNHQVGDFVSNQVNSIARGDYRSKTEQEISGSGYVVRSLEAALWCFWHAADFRDAILRAANLGNDADTTAAICGQIAGAHFGEAGIPEDWRRKVVMGAEIRQLAEQLHELTGDPS